VTLVALDQSNHPGQNTQAGAPAVGTLSIEAPACVGATGPRGARVIPVSSTSRRLQEAVAPGSDGVGDARMAIALQQGV
jgi:hypothetical protein